MLEQQLRRQRRKKKKKQKYQYGMHDSRGRREFDDTEPALESVSTFQQGLDQGLLSELRVLERRTHTRPFQ